MNLEILMATMFKKNINELDLRGKGVTSDILIINQTDTSDSFIDKNVRMLSFRERGSSNSRNRAFENAKGDVCLIADDDVIFKPGYKEIVLDCFKNNPEADIITFQIEADDGTLLKNNYLKNERWHNRWTVLKCASIEIAFKRDSIIKRKLKMDTEFGLGSKFKINDEVIFLTDCLNSGLKIKYCPVPIVIHPGRGAGLNYTEHMIFSKGAAFLRLFGALSFFMNIYFAVKKYKEYREKYTFMNFLHLLFEGSREYRKSHD